MNIESAHELHSETKQKLLTCIVLRLLKLRNEHKKFYTLKAKWEHQFCKHNIGAQPRPVRC